MTTHYAPTETGGMRFISERRPGDVRIPNYVYDIWMPLLGIDAIGIYAVYCRLERQDTVKAMSQQRLAREMRVGIGKLNRINELLETHGFIKVRKPQGHEKLMHYTIEITMYDPPRSVPAEAIEEHQHPQGYEVLCPWLEATEVPNSHADDTEQSCDALPNSNANFVSPVAPSEVERAADAALFYGDDGPPSREPITTNLPTSAKDTLDLVAKTAQARAQEKQWTTPLGDDPWNVTLEAWGQLTQKAVNEMGEGMCVLLKQKFQQVGVITDSTAPDVASAIGRFKERYGWWDDDWPSDGFTNRLGMLLVPDAKEAHVVHTGYREDSPGAV